MDDAALGAMLRFGAVAAGLNCQFVGCHPPTRAEVDAMLAG
jgi:fructokinase